MLICISLKSIAFIKLEANNPVTREGLMYGNGFLRFCPHSDQYLQKSKSLMISPN